MFFPTESGVIEVANGVLSYQSAHYGAWWLPLTTICRIEEYTDSSGLFVDDYSFRFSTATGEERSASFYAVGWEEVWPALERSFPGVEAPGLCNSTEVKVRLLWPMQKKEAKLEVSDSPQRGSGPGLSKP